MFYRRRFSIEDWLGPFEGWTSDERWNGWACPYFEFDSAMKIMDTWNTLTFCGAVFESRYDESQDVFRFYESSGGDWDHFGPESIEVAGKSIKVYPIGAFCWTWIEENEA
jgi:hypothetical protein